MIGFIEGRVTAGSGPLILCSLRPENMAFLNQITFNGFGDHKMAGRFPVAPRFESLSLRYLFSKIRSRGKAFGLFLKPAADGEHVLLIVRYGDVHGDFLSSRKIGEYRKRTNDLGRPN